jgi:transposase
MWENTASDGITGFDMPGPQPPTITLTEAERQGLQQLIQRHSTPQQIALRARIILLAAAGQNHAQIAQTLNVSIDMARLWRQRWLALQPITLEDLSLAERLDDLPRPGTPPRLTADQICQIERLACEKPEQSERPISQWTGREIADELLKRGIVDTISPRHAARLLKRGASSPT